jgi:predicted Fe-Mo cluster-binding NifX family protein
METIIIPHFGERISPRLDYAEDFQLLTIENHEVIKVESIKIITKSRLERINRIIRVNPDLIICNGLTERCYVELTKSKIRVIPWMQGEVKDVLKNYLSGFIRGTGSYTFGNNLINR